MFIAEVLVGPSKQLKQIIQIEHNIVKNPNCPEANQLAIYKRGRGFQLGATQKQIQVVVRAGLEPRTAETLTPGTKILVSARLQTWKHISAQ